MDIFEDLMNWYKDLPFSTTWITINIALLIGFIIILFVWKKKETLSNHRRFVDFMPSLLSVWGVLGTFIGISYGLHAFGGSNDVQNINNSIDSITILLNGMKTAFYTSLAGMASSLILQWIISQVIDKAEKQTDISIAATQIVEAVVKLDNTLQKQTKQQDQNQTIFYDIATKEIKSINGKLSEFVSLLNNLNSKAEGIGASVKEIKVSSKIQEDKLREIHTGTKDISSFSQKIYNMEDKMKDSLLQIANFSRSLETIILSINKNTEELIGNTFALSSGQAEVLDKVNRIGEKLHNEVIDIEDKMSETNNLLTEKFDEFSILLKKSNTEALVEVMKKVTEEFQKQMNDLISRLVQENFQKLNESVEQLNTWQIENKEMISSLTRQYTQMAIDFEGTSTTLANVGNNTQSLVSEGGKLQQIINALDRVMVRDEKFIQITKNLSNAAENANDANEKFNISAQKLSDWIQKQKNFAEAVAVLINKLNDINKINDYSSTFWSETKKGMNDSVNVLQTGSRQLQQQIEDINKSFYERLGATFAELDSLITSLMNGRR